MRRLTAREYYDLLVRSAKDGTFPSFDVKTKTCLYQSPCSDGIVYRCAIGILIPDHLYDIQFDRANMKVDDLPKSVLEQVTPFDMTLIDLNNIQRCHDELANRIWNTAEFIASINRLDCFRHIKKFDEEGLV